MRRVLTFIFILGCCVFAGATNYYVSSSAGSDSNSGTTPGAAWKTFSATGNHVNSGSFAPGDVIYLKRGDTWNEQLIPPSSGASGNPIAFDAYGTGDAPVITAATSVPLAAGWTYVSGNVWKTTAAITTGMIAGTTVDMVQFGAVYGRHQPYGSGCASSIVGKYDWCLVGLTLYVYSGNVSTPPAATYENDRTITAYVDSGSGLAMVSVVNKSWLTFQHIKVQGFSYLGVSVTGTSDNLVFANMESDGMVPYGTTPHGFFVNVSSGYGTSIQFVNCDAHLNYDGFRIAGASAVALTNCRGYANRDAGLRDATSGSVSPVTYSYSHFYGNNIAQLPTSDVVGGSATPVAGSGNISSSVAPVLSNFKTYPARFSFTVDDVGSADGTEEYIESFVSLFSDRGIHFNAAVVPSYTVNWDDVRSWYVGGNEIDSHSWSHQYYTTTSSPAGTCTPATCPNAPAMVIQYTGAGTAATLSIVGGMLSTNVTGASSDNIPATNLNSYTASSLYQYLQSFPHYVVQQNSDLWKANNWPVSRPNTKSKNLLAVSAQDIKSAAYTVVYDQSLLLPDEMSSSKTEIQNNVPGPNENFLVYPDGIEDPNSESFAVAAGYAAARGSLAMKGQDNSTGSANSVYSNGVNIQNITSLGVMGWIHGTTQAQVNQLAASLVFRAAAWGVPYGLFAHFNSRNENPPTPDISNTELGWLLDAITANGGLWMTNTALASAITSGTGLSGSTRYVQNPSGGTANFAVPGAHAPTVGRGVATSYPVDLNGVDRSALGTWDIGASAYLSQRYGTKTGSGSTRIGGWSSSVSNSVALPQNWVNSNEWRGTITNAIAFPASGSGGGWSCGVTNYGPYTAGSQSSLQQAINDAEACRKANGSGTTITIPAGALFAGGPGLTLPQSVGDNSTNFIVLQSSTPLPVGRTVCSHGIQDNLPESTQPGIRNLGCNGSSMSYQLGTAVTTVSGAFTLANGIATNTSAYNDVASMYTIECSGANCNGIQTANPDTNGVGPHHYAIANAEVRPQAGLTGISAPILLGLGTETAVSQIANHIHLAYVYVHGDWTDAPVSGGVATSYPTGANSLPNDVAFSGCIYCSISYSYIDKSLRPGSEGHGISTKLTQQLKIVHNWVEGQSTGFLSGGWASAITINNFVSTRDVEDRGNRYTYPYSWILANAAGYCVNGLACSGNSYVRKNAHEYKFSDRILLDGNIFENADYSGAQGTTISFKTAQYSGGQNGPNYWTQQTNSTITNNIIRNGCDGASMGDRSDNSGTNGGGVSLQAGLYTYTNNLMYNISQGNPGCTGAPGPYAIRVASSAQGTTWSASAVRDSAGLTSTLTLNAGAGTGVSAFSVGEPVLVTGCADSSFNTSATWPQTTMGAPALAGTQTFGLTVVYSNSGTANAATTGCTVYNIQGTPDHLFAAHNSDFMLLTGVSVGDPASSQLGTGGGNPCILATNLTYTNTISVGGGASANALGEGTRTTNCAFDPATLAYNNVAIPGRDGAATCPGHSAGVGGIAACYTEYSDAHVAVHPPQTLYGAITSYCPGNDPTAGCLGLVGEMSSGAFNFALGNWHQYRLCRAGDAACGGKASPFAAGGALDASDGKDLGADLSLVEGAQTAVQYCTPNCGIGSFSDLP